MKVRSADAGRASAPAGRGDGGTEAAKLSIGLDAVLAAAEDKLRLAVAPHGSQVRVCRVSMMGAEPGPEAGDLVLGSACTEERSCTELVNAAARRNAAAVVLREEQLTSTIVQSAWGAGLSVLTADSRISWTILHRLLDAAMTTNRQPAGGDPDHGERDLFDLCELFATALDGPVAIEDTEFYVVAYSSRGPSGDEYRRRAILQRRTTDEWLHWLTDSDTLTRLQSSDDVISIKADQFGTGSHRRMITGIRRGQEFLGVIWACESAGGFPDQAVDLMREFATLAAAELTRRRNVSARRYDRAGQLLSELLSGAGDHRPLMALWQMLDEGSAVLAGLQAAPGQELGVQDIAQGLTVQLGAVSNSAAIMTSDSTVYVLAIATHDGTTPVLDVRARLATVTARLETTQGARLLTALTTAHPLPKTRAARDEVDRVLRALRHPAAGLSIATYAEVAQLVTMIELGDFLEERPHLRHRALAEIVAHDERHGSDHTETLRAYLESFGNVPHAARLLNLHPNSFRYRLRRLSELFQLDLDDPDERMLLQLQLRCGTTRAGTPS